MFYMVIDNDKALVPKKYWWCSLVELLECQHLKHNWSGNGYRSIEVHQLPRTVMLVGTLVYGIKYTLPEYLCTFLVAGGVSAFALSKTSSKTISKLAHPNAPVGYGLCFLNLGLDGFTNATQDSIKERYPKTSAWEMMLGMNLWGTIYNVICMFGWPHGIGFEAVQFCKQIQKQPGTSSCTASVEQWVRTSPS